MWSRIRILAPILVVLLSFVLRIAAIPQQPKLPQPSVPTLGAIGIAVQDIQKSKDFYTSTLGLIDTGVTFDTPLFYEIILTLPTARPGSALVLMKWKTPKETKNLPIKLVYYVEDVKATVEKIRAKGLEIVTEPNSAKLANRTIPTAFARDPDGYLIELNPLNFASAIAKGQS